MCANRAQTTLSLETSSNVRFSSPDPTASLMEKELEDNSGRQEMRRKKCCRCWKTGVPPTWLVICGAILVQVGFGLYPVVVKKFAVTGDRQTNPYIFSFYRDFGCFPLLFICALAAEHKILIPSLKMLTLFMGLGLIGMFGGQLLYISGVYKVGPNIASAIQPLIPVWTAILAIISCTESVSSPLMLHAWTKVFGILLAAGGAVEVILTGRDDVDTSSPHTSSSVGERFFGYLCLFGNTFCMACYVLLQKRFIFNRTGSKWKEYPVTVTAYSYFFGAMFMGLFSIYYAVTGQSQEFQIPQKAAYALVYAIFVASAFCYLVITWTNMHLSSTIATAFWPAQVLVTVVTAYFITGDELEALQYLGAVMLIVGLMLVLYSNYMEERYAAGKSVLRLDGCCSNGTTQHTTEESPLLASADSHKQYEGTT